MKYRAFQAPGGNVRVVHPNPKMRLPEETDDAFIARIGANVVVKDPTLAGLPFVDVQQTAIDGLSRAQRHKWRIQGQTAAIDPTVPDPPHPKQALLDQVDAATTIAGLKVVIKALIG